jgi:hypothetical protein
VLLLDEGRKKSAGAMFPPQPVVCDAPGGGFFAAWPELLNTIARRPVELRRYAPPRWTVGGEATGIELDSYVHQLALSPSGRYLAIGCASGRWQAELRDLQSGRIAVIEQPRAVTALCFDPQEQRLMLASEQQLTVVSIGAAMSNSACRFRADAERSRIIRAPTCCWPSMDRGNCSSSIG